LEIQEYKGKIMVSI